MMRIGCLSAILVGKKKKSKYSPKSIDAKNACGYKAKENYQVKPEESIYSPVKKLDNDACLEPLDTQEKSHLNKLKVVSNENPIKADSTQENAYEASDEKDGTISMTKREFSDFDLQAQAEGKDGRNSSDAIGSDHRASNNGDLATEIGHASDPGIGQKMNLWAAPSLKRSCSNIETRRSGSESLDSHMKAGSCDGLHNLMGNVAKETPNGITGSPVSVKMSGSADQVMLKKRSSSQVLPSRSRKLWWKLFLWSHRNLHRRRGSKLHRTADPHDASDQKGGYASDTLVPSHVIDTKKKNKVVEEPENQWIAFCAESSSLDRVDAWVNSLKGGVPNDEDENEIEVGEASEVIRYLNSSEIGESSGKNQAEADAVVQSLNTLSSVAHISGMSLKVIPPISAFASLRAVNLSTNFIVHVSPGSLPKSLHTLDLSRNKIASIEGLRELTRLRVLDLSYNRISRIGRGLSNCTAIKELYLAGNKISDVEGLHRLLKLTVLDLSFNKITTTNALGQLVANYNSLLALNLLGNAVQSNIGDDQLRKAVSGLLPHLAYLNKQPIKPQRVREVATDSVAKAALGNSRWGSRRKLTRRLSQSSNTPIKSGPGEGSRNRGTGAGQKCSSKHKSWKYTYGL